MDEFVKQVRASSENFYVNVHSQEYPDGVVRCQLVATKGEPGPGPGPGPKPVDGARTVGAYGVAVGAVGLAMLLVVVD